MKIATALTLLASTSVLAQNPTPSGGDPPFVPPAVNRATLNDLYKSTGGPQWKVSTGWGTDSDYCTWYGVTCVYTNHNITTHIRLAQNNLVGTIPDNIGDLADLKVIDLSGNAISGTIPESLSKLFFIIKCVQLPHTHSSPLPRAFTLLTDLLPVLAIPSLCRHYFYHGGHQFQWQ